MGVKATSLTSQLLSFLSEVLTNLLDNKNELLLPGPATPSTNPLLGLGSMVTPTHSLMDQSGTDCEEVRSREQLEVVLKAPSAYGIKADQERVTYLNRGNQGCQSFRFYPNIQIFVPS